MVKKINIENTLSVFISLLNGTMSREKGADWAKELREYDDSNAIIYEPQEAEALLWDAIIFLEGVDLKDTPHTYLHNEEDITKEFEKLLNY